MRRLLLTSILFAFVAACSDSDNNPTGPVTQDPPPPSNPAVTGSWTGTLQQVFGFQMVLSESGGNITGSGTFSAPGDQVAISVTGTHAFPNISMTIRPSGFQEMNFAGAVAPNGNSITGTVSGSGFNNQGLTLTRQ